MRSARPIEDIQAELYEAARLNALGAFAAAIAHEINQPLAAIANYAEAARQLAATRAPEHMPAIEAVLGKLDHQAARVAQIVRDLRAVIAQRQQAGADQSDRAQPHTALAPALADAVAVARIGAGEAGGSAIEMRLALAPDLPPAAIAPVPLQLVVVQLVRNACHAMAGRARSALTVAARPSDGAIEVTVCDNGPGLAPAAAASLFQPFKSTTPDGLGIGLATCKAIVEAHDGRLWYEPGPSGGAVFRFTIPTAAAATNDADASR